MLKSDGKSICARVASAKNSEHQRVVISQTPLASPSNPNDLIPDDLKGENFNREGVKDFNKLANESKGIFKVVQLGRLDEEIKDIIENKGDEENGLDLIFAIDATASMKEEIDFVKEKLIDILYEKDNSIGPLRVGLVLYRDYNDNDLFLTKEYLFSSNLLQIEQDINGIAIHGGGSKPEAVYEALYAAITKFDWQGPHREVILIGDAPAHPIPVKNIDYQLVKELALRHGVVFNTIILPD